MLANYSSITGNHWLIHTWAAKTSLALLWMSPSWPLFHSRLLHIPFSQMAWDAAEGFPLWWLGLALPYFARLDLAVHPKSQISSTCKSDRYTPYTSQVRKIQIAQQYIQWYTFLFKFTFSWASWEEPAGSQLLIQAQSVYVRCHCEGLPHTNKFFLSGFKSNFFFFK